MGIGIDLENEGALERFGPGGLHRFLHRWFTPSERLWCVAQPNLARALVVGMTCKEAAFKATGSPGLSLDQVEVAMASEGVVTSAWLRGSSLHSGSRVVWLAAEPGILALAVDAGVPSRVLHELLQAGRTTVRRNYRLASGTGATVGSHEDGRAEPARYPE